MQYLFSSQTLIVYAFFIFIVSVIPVSISHPPFHSSDKAVHFFIYILFSFLAINTFIKQGKPYCKTRAFVYSFCIGLIIECIQFFLPYRSFETRDIVANFIGSFAGIFIKVL